MININNLTIEQKVDIISKYRRNLQSRFKNIESRVKSGKVNISTFSLDEYGDFVKNIPSKSKLKKMKPSDINAMLRDVLYIDSLKSSSVKGAIQSYRVFNETQKRLDSMSENLKAKFWDTWKKIYNDNRILEYFKYTIFDTLSQEITNENSDELAIKIDEAYRKAYERTHNDVTERDFSAALNDIFKD